MESSYKIVEIKTAGPAFEQYKPLVLATWLRSLKYGSDFFELADNRSYFTTYSKVILNLLKRPECRGRIAVLSSEPDVAIGYSIYEGKVLHFIFVRRGGKGEESGRKQGIGTELMPQGIEVFTHVTKVGKAIWKKKYKDLKFNPF